MSQQLNDLIEKINRQAIQNAEAKAKDIETEAKKKAEEIILQAKNYAQQIIKETKEKMDKETQMHQAKLQQATRDMLLDLKSQLQQILLNIVKKEIRSVLTPQELVTILSIIIQRKDQGNDFPDQITVELNNQDAQKLQEYFLEKLQSNLKKELILRPATDIQAGFRISFDQDKSQFDFSEQALAEYVFRYLKPGLQEILNIL